MIAFIGAGAVAFALGVGGVAFALTSNDGPTGPTPGTSVSQFTSSSKKKPSTTTEPTTAFTPAPEQGAPDNHGGQTTWESTPSVSESESSWPTEQPSGTTTEPTPPPVTTQAPTPTPTPGS